MSAGGGAAGPRAGSGVYSPLHQLISDSESEEESRKLPSLDHEPASITSKDIDSGLQSAQQKGLSFNEVLSMHHMLAHMTFERRIGFALSLLAVVIYVVVFLGMFSCSEGTCALVYLRPPLNSWEYSYDGIEFSGAVQIVDSRFPNIKNLLLIFRCNCMVAILSDNDVTYNGIMIIEGSTGKIFSSMRESAIPTRVDCHMLDANENGRKDCLILATQGQLAAINPLIGQYSWQLPGYLKGLSFHFPVLVEDLNGDNVSDLLMPVSIRHNSNFNSLMLVSGASGDTIGKPFDFCGNLDIHNLVLNSSNRVSFRCRNVTFEKQYLMPLEEIHHRIMTAPTVLSHVSSYNLLPDPGYKKTGNTVNVFSNGIGELLVENSGDCPDNCRVNLKLILQINGATSVAWEHGANHVFAMRPSSFAFANSIHGFILKLRQWNSALFVKNARNVSETKYNVQNQSPKDFYNIFNNYRRSINVSSLAAFVNRNEFTVYDISERIVLITFDQSNVHIVNVSLTDIVQVCVQYMVPAEMEVPFCQPDFNYQERSLVIADLDGDGSHELVTYHSTFTPTDSASISKSWQLNSVVKVIRLESELPKLFVTSQ